RLRLTPCGRGCYVCLRRTPVASRLPPLPCATGPTDGVWPYAVGLFSATPQKFPSLPAHPKSPRFRPDCLWPWLSCPRFPPPCPTTPETIPPPSAITPCPCVRSTKDRKSVV